MNQTRVISSIDLNDEYFDLDASLSDIGETISLYEYDCNDESQNSKKLTWEEWYIKKKIEKLKNEKKMQNDMENKILSNKKYRNLTEEEKNKKLMEWLRKKRDERKKLEDLKKKQDENQKIVEKKEDDKKKFEKKFQEWLENLKNKKQEEKERKKIDEQNKREKEEEEKIKKAEAEKRLKENKKEIIKVRPLSKRNGVAIVNGKSRSFFDWSTSPSPSFINKNEWKN